MDKWLIYTEEGSLSAIALPPWAVAAAAVLLVLLLGLLIWQISRNAKGRGGKAGAAPDRSRVERLTVGKLHEQGAREGQQDCFAVSDEALMSTHGLLAVVADGMGGLADGDKVSTAAVQAVLDEFTMCPAAGEPEQVLLSLARKAAQEVNRLLGPEGLRKSGSTLVMGLVKNGNFSFLSIGDSRICLCRDGVLMQLNREHVYRNDLALRAVNGELSVSEAFSDPQGSGLISFLGMGKLTQVDLPAAPFRLLPGDKLLLMSDGVYNALSDQELTQALQGEPEQAAQAIQTAIQAKNYTNQDNYTAVILGCGGTGEQALEG